MPRICVVLLAVAALAAVAAGCGPGEGGGSSDAVTLVVTRDQGRHQVLRESASGVPASETVMRLLERRADVTTRFGGGFVQCIDKLCGASGSKQVDWFYFVNGVQAPKGAAATKVRGGDTIWWDRRDWRGSSDVEAVVGSFPEPFVHGPGSPKRLPVRVECTDLQSKACDAVQDELVAAGVPAAKATPGSSFTEQTLRVLVGPWARIRGDVTLAELEGGPHASGVFAEPRPDGRNITLLDVRGKPVTTAGAGTGLVAATAAAGEPPVWTVTGTDDAGVLAAAQAFRVRDLRDHFAIAVAGGRVTPLPVPEEPR